MSPSGWSRRTSKWWRVWAFACGRGVGASWICRLRVGWIVIRGLGCGLASGASLGVGGKEEPVGLLVGLREPGMGEARGWAERVGLEWVEGYASLSAEGALVHVRWRGGPADDVLARLREDPAVRFAEVDGKRVLAGMAVPDDPYFFRQWPLRNSGQYVNGYAGTAGVDLGFLEAWGMARPAAGEVVVGLIDSGVDLVHPDLVGNVWVNVGEVPGDGLDNDGNGRVDDVHGYDFADGDANPADEIGHGTHLAGIVAAAASNGLGTAGAAFHARVMPLKITLREGGVIDVSAEIAAINYAVMMKARGVNVVALNASFSGPVESLAERAAIQAAGNAGVVFCAAAGNDGSDNTAEPVYPAGHRLANMVVAAASDSDDRLAATSNFGSKVDLAAPGVDIYSAKPVWPTPYNDQMTVTATLERGEVKVAAVPVVYSGMASGLNGALVDCGSGLGPAEFPAGVRGQVALIQRGGATFAVKAANAMRAGAVAVVFYNNSTAPVTASLGLPGAWVPAHFVSQADGLALRAALPLVVTLSNAADPATLGRFADGTSTATPFVAAAVAFAARNFPDETAAQRVARVLGAVVPSGYLAGKVATGGRLTLTGVVDPGRNGLPDWWESELFGAVGVDPGADPDSDRFSNLLEFRMGTRPLDGGSRLAVSRVAVVDDGAGRHFRVEFPTAVGVVYRVERGGLDGAGGWVAVGADVVGDGRVAGVIDSNALGLARERYYRVRVVSP